MDFPFVREAVTKLFSKPSCAMYPFEPSDAAPNYRGRIVFHPETCINCNMCERVCAGGAITHTSVKNEDGDDVVTRSFDLGSCTFCATCADFCTRHSIELTQDYHMIGIEEGDLIVSGTFVKKAVKKPAPKPAAAPAAAPAEKKADAPAAEAAPAAPAVEPRGDGKPTQADPGSEQVRLLHDLREEMPRRGPDRRPQGEGLEARRGQVRRLRHLRRRLPEERHRALIRKANNMKKEL